MMNNNIEKTMDVAKTYPSFVSMKQRVVAAFTALILLLQICFPTVAYAVMLVSDDSIVATMSQSQFKLSTSNSYLYEQANYQDASFANTKNINTFYNDLIAAGINVAGVPAGKPIGDVYVQSRYIRQQIIEQIGRHLINTADSSVDEIQQINNLYAAAKIFAASNGTYKYGDNLPASLKIESNMIWPEKRTINGEQVMVPIAYLAHTTVVDNSVNNNKTEFKSGVATFKRVTLDQTALTTGTNTVLRTGDLLLSGGTITSPGALTLVVGGTLQNLSGSIRTESDLNIIAMQVANKTTVIPFVSKYGSGTHLGKVANIEAGGNLTIKSYGDIAFEGATAQAVNGAITFNANGNINLQPAATQTQSEYQSGHWKVNESTLELLQSKLGAENTITLMAGGTITIAASELHSTKGGIELLAKHGIYIADEQGHFQSNRVDKIGRTTGTGSDFESFAIRSVLSAGKGILLATDAGDIELKGAKITSTEGTQVKASNGKVRLLVTKENSQHYLDTVRKGNWTIKTVHEEYVKETGIPNAIVGGLAVEALLGVDIEYAGREGATLAEQMAEYDKMPDTKWMADIYYGDTKFKDANGNLVPLNMTMVTEAYTHIRNVDRSLSPAAMAIIAICVAVALGGAGAGLIGTGPNAIGVTAATATEGLSLSAAAMQAGVLTLSTSAAQNLAAGKSLEDTLKAMTTEDALKNLAISMATAGALSELGDLELFNKAKVAATPQLAFANQAFQAVTNSVVTAGISVTINGGNSDDYLNAFKVSLATNAINTIGQNLAKNIASADSLNKVTQYISNAALGCLTGGLSAKLNDQDAKDACASAAGGAIIAVGLADILEQKTKELINTTVSDQGVSQSSAELAATLSYLSKNRVDISKLFAGLVAFAAQGDVNAAGNSASLIGTAQEMRIMRTVALGQTIHAMGMANCGDMSLSECGKVAGINEFRKGLIEEGKRSVEAIDAKIAYLEENTTFFDDLGAFNAAILRTNGSLEGLTKLSSSYPDPNTPLTNSNVPEEVIVIGSEWSIMRKALYGVGETAGKAVNTADGIVQEGIQKLLEKPYGAPIKWGFGKIAEAAKKYPEIAAVVNAPDEFTKAMGVGSAAILGGDEFAPTKQYLESENESLPVWDRSSHESMFNVSSGYAWLIAAVGAGALAYAAKAVKYTRVAADGTKFSNGEEDFYKNEIAAEFTKISRIQLRNHLVTRNITLKPGWNADRLYDEVLSMPKPNRPTPDKYLSQEYIAAKLAEFDSGVVRIQARDKLVDGKFTSKYESFAMPYSEWERIKLETGGDLVEIQKKLGLTEPINLNNTVIMKFDKKDLSNLSAPTGNENPFDQSSGANMLWAPGLKTNNGVTEAVFTVSKPTTFVELYL